MSDRGARTADGTADPRTCPVCASTQLPGAASIRGPDRLLGTPGTFEVRVCEACGSGVTYPRLGEEQLDAYYRADYGSHVEASRGSYARVSAVLKRAQVDALLRRRPFSSALRATPARALDVGCARGDLGAGLHARGWQVDGIEPSRRAAALATRRGVRVLGSTLASAELASASYELVVLRHALEHIPEPRAAMQMLARALSPTGRLVISLPNFASWQRARFGGRWFHLDLPRHRVHLTPSSLDVLLKSAGLQARERFTTTSVLGLPASVQYVLARRCLAPSGFRLRAAAAACCAMFPLTWLIDALGQRDTIHVVAERAR